jgi:hypothetical protein
MNMLTKSLLSAGAAAAALVTVAAPAQAQRYDRYDRNRDGISAGEVIAGAVILGGIAAVIASSDNDRSRGYDDGRYNDRDYSRGGYDNRGYGYNNGNGSRRAVNQCVSTVENWANGYSRSNVTQINNIERMRGGYRVTGKLVVQDGWRGNNRGYGNDRYDRGDRYDRNNGYGNNGYGYNQGHNRGYERGYDQGRFTCFVERGRVIDVDYRGLDQWR